MGKISNEQKAKEIAKSNGINYKNHSKYEDDMDSTLECYKSALEAMDWKDEKFQKVLDYTEVCYGVFSFGQREDFINHIKDIFYGKE